MIYLFYALVSNYLRRTAPMLIIAPLCTAVIQHSVVVRKESTDDFDAHDDG
jgi:hypothetical protein